MTALQLIKKQKEIRYCDVSTRHGVIRAEFPVPQVADPKLVRLAIRRQAQENLAMVRKRR